jgi:hypothetical protein
LVFLVDVEAVLDPVEVSVRLHPHTDSVLVVDPAVGRAVVVSVLGPEYDLSPLVGVLDVEGAVVVRVLRTAQYLAGALVHDDLDLRSSIPIRVEGPVDVDLLSLPASLLLEDRFRELPLVRGGRSSERILALLGLQPGLLLVADRLLDRLLLVDRGEQLLLPLELLLDLRLEILLAGELVLDLAVEFVLARAAATRGHRAPATAPLEGDVSGDEAVKGEEHGSDGGAVAASDLASHDGPDDQAFHGALGPPADTTARSGLRRRRRLGFVAVGGFPRSRIRGPRIGTR